MITDPALLGLIGTLAAAGIAWLTAAQVRTSQTQTRQAQHIKRIESENRALWYYTRYLIDWGYRPHGPGDIPPAPPDPIAHLYEFGDST